MTKDTSPPAFPALRPSPHEYGQGMTLRQYAAIKAMQGLISGCFAGNNFGFTVRGNVVAALEYADALIAELEKGQSDETN